MTQPNFEKMAREFLRAKRPFNANSQIKQWPYSYWQEDVDYVSNALQSAFEAGQAAERERNRRPIEVGTSTDAVDKAGAWDTVAAARKEERQKRTDIETALIEALKEAGDVIQSYHKTTGIDLGDASNMPFYGETMKKIDNALKLAEGE